MYVYLYQYYGRGPRERMNPKGANVTNFDAQILDLIAICRKWCLSGLATSTTLVTWPGLPGLGPGPTLQQVLLAQSMCLPGLGPGPALR